ncbi:MAG TPA: CBS domain-containing protein [Jiangellales bacterium]|nr:CBS domain-containing protein [Jiangellales bacterium]
MRIADVLRSKGATVLTVTPDMTVRDLVAMLAEHRIGATVVSVDGGSVDGIVSERDVVRALAARGAAVLSERVADIMTAEVQTCKPDASVNDLMRTMTEGRFRHVPVVVEGRLSGIVSIGDVVKTRIGELETERESLERYISSGSS